MSVLTGRVLKNYNGFYYVVTPEGEQYTCKLKGKLKQKRFSLATGDLVELELNPKVAGEAMITTILPRKNFLQRPTMANLDLFVLTMACATPDFSYLIADKLLLLAEQAKIHAILVLNKTDLVAPEQVEAIAAVYRKIGYDVYPIVAKTGAGVEALRERLQGKICAFGGPSGVGKSSTINAIDNTVELRTGSVSDKIGRGKHTTRFAELLPFAGGYIADTPGFGNLYLEGLEKEQVPLLFREFAEYEHTCKYCPCSHTHEPVCGVKEAVAKGDIAASRYESYCDILDELKELQEREGKRLW